LPSGPTPPHGLFPRPSSVPLHDCSRANDFCTGRARSEATISRSGRSCSGSRAFRASTQYQFCQGDRLYTSQSALKGTELHRPVLGSDAFIKEDDPRRRQQRQREEEKNIDDSDNNDDGQPQREADTVVGALTVIESGRICPSRKKEGSARPGKRQRSPLPSSFPILKPDQKEAKSHSDDCSDELGITHIKSDEKDRRLRPAKRKRPSLFNGKPAQRKRQHHLQQQSPRQPQARLTAQWHCAKTHLLSPTPSAQEVMNTDMSSDCCVSSTSSRVNLLVLTKVTFCPHSSLHFCSFTAVIRAGHDQPEFSFDPFTRLIKEIGHVGEVTVSTVKPLPQHQFLLTGFSRHTLPRNLHSQRTTGFASAASSFCEGGARTSAPA